MADSLRIYVRDRFRRRVGELDDFRKLTVVLKHAGSGSWSIDLSAQSRLAGVLTTPGNGVIIERNGEVLISGPRVTQRRELSETDDTLTVSGGDDALWISRRLAWPCDYPWTAQEFDVQSGPAENVMKYYVSRNLGALAPLTRQVSGWTIAPNRDSGLVIGAQARFDKLDDLLSTIAVAGGDLGYSAKQLQDTTTIEFDAFEPADKTGLVRLSLKMGNLAGFDYEESAPTGTYVIVSGDGDGTEQVLQFGIGNDVETWGIIESPVIAASTEDDMNTALYKGLVSAGSSLAINTKPMDTTYMNYGRDWNVSDRVTVEIDGQTFTEVVRQVTLTYAQGAAETVEAVIGTPEATAPIVPRLFAAYRTQQQRIYKLERRA